MRHTVANDEATVQLPATPDPAPAFPSYDDATAQLSVFSDPAPAFPPYVQPANVAGADEVGEVAPDGRSARSVWPLLLAAAIGGAVSVALGTYGRLHSPTGDTVESFGFPDVYVMKAWFGTGAAALALLQLTSALWMWGRLPFAGKAPAWVATAHRWTGTVAFLLTLPAAYHCLWSLGFKDTDTRVLAHSILGCAFYGAFTTKMLVLRSETVPRWAVPVMGGALVALLAGIWLTSSLWFFTNVSFPGV
jgi:hypothetical protein